MPTIPLTPLHHAIALLAGRWEGMETIHPSPWDPTGATASAVVVNQVATSGLTVVQDYAQSRDARVVFTGHGVFYVEGDSIVLRWWDNWSPVPSEFRGGLLGDTITLLRHDAKGLARATWRVGPEAYDYALEVSPDQKEWHRYMEATYARTAD